MLQQSWAEVTIKLRGESCYASYIIVTIAIAIVIVIRVIVINIAVRANSFVGFDRQLNHVGSPYIIVVVITTHEMGA